MLSKRKLTYTCERDSEFTTRLIENLLIPLANNKEKLDGQFFQELQSRYGHLLEDLAPQWIHGLTEQYVAAKLFGPERLLKDYMKEPKIRSRSGREQTFLESKLFNPWRFAFMRTAEDWGDDFFEMHNVLTDETFLLYSPGVGKYEEEGRQSLYFSLLTCNGKCYQTYGPIIPFLGLQPFDLLFFGGQLDDTIVEYSKVEERLQKDPLPFMMLIVASGFPLSYHKDDLMTISLSKLYVDSLDLEHWRDAFKIEEKEGVYQLDLKRWWLHPHFAHCHYAPKDAKFVASAATDRGWEKLVQAVRRLGVELDFDPQVHTTFIGAIATERILGKSGAKSPYASLFVPETTPEEQGDLDKANHFLSLLIPYLNEGRECDLHELAEQAGMAYEDAQMIAEQVMEKLKEMR